MFDRLRDFASLMLCGDGQEQLHDNLGSTRPQNVVPQVFSI